MFGRSKTVKPSEIEELTATIAGLKGEIRALRTEKDRTAEVTALQQQIADLEIRKAKIVSDQEIRELTTKHKIGLLKAEWEQEKALQQRENEAALKEARLTVREENLAADRARFEEQMAFHKEQIAGEISRFERLAHQLMERLPTIEVNLEGPAQTAPARSSRRASSKEE